MVPEDLQLNVLYVDKKGEISIVTAGQGAIAGADPDRKSQLSKRQGLPGLLVSGIW